MRDHIERRAAELRGMGGARGRHRQASVMFGNAAAVREQSRGFRLWGSLESTSQTCGTRGGNAPEPAVAATAVLSLALAIGANTAIYSVIDAALLRPLPVAEPERLITLAAPDFARWRDGPGERDTSAIRCFFSFVRQRAIRPALGFSPQRIAWRRSLLTRTLPWKC